MDVLSQEAPEALDAALRALSRGAVVAVPTDTVYGLAADLNQPAAVAGVFTAKGRPPGLALPVLVSGLDQVDALSPGWRGGVGWVEQLASRLWPGAVTLVLPGRPGLGELVGGSDGTVGIRWPRHHFVEQLCLAAGPLAVTSANLHGRPPCTTARAVAATAWPGGLVTTVVDGGDCAGAPSTVVDCTRAAPHILRAGSVAPDDVLRAAGLR